ncbi:MAG: SulP family inorganic anion transporter, partial [Pseudomonadota bacterium]
MAATFRSPVAAKTEILSGLTVALALVPEAVAFSFVAGVHPLVGLHAAFMVGLITSIFGGRPGMISGATGALAVVMVALVAQHGVEYLFAAVVLMGILQLLAGIFRLGKFIRMVPHPVMLGFVNGLAIVIFLAQLSQFKVPSPGGGTEWMQGGQ